MIALASGCLMFETAAGESIPLSPEMVSIEFMGETAKRFDSEFLNHAANAVFYYFKHELGRQTVTVGEFTLALERVLRGFKLGEEKAAQEEKVRVEQSDLRTLATESGKGCELFFFPRLRDEVRAQLKRSPQVLQFRGLRGCVKQLAGAQRWSARCEFLRDQILEFLRNCLSAEADERHCTLLVEQ